MTESQSRVMGKILRTSFDEENSENEMSDLISKSDDKQLRFKDAVKKKHEKRKIGVLNYSSKEPKLRSRQQNSLFTEDETGQYDVEAVKLNNERFKRIRV